WACPPRCRWAIPPLSRSRAHRRHPRRWRRGSTPSSCSQRSSTTASASTNRTPASRCCSICESLPSESARPAASLRSPPAPPSRRGHKWDEFIRRYRCGVEKGCCSFVVVDSLNALDPTRARTADHLAVLKPYNHDKGVTCVTVGQFGDTGEPAGGEALIHTAD